MVLEVSAAFGVSYENSASIIAFQALSSAASGLVWRQFRVLYLPSFSSYPDPITFAQASQGEAEEGGLQQR